jgi:hypothetical protein
MARQVQCPGRGCSVTRAIMEVLYHLNDEHDWSRERIADWLEAL